MAKYDEFMYISQFPKKIQSSIRDALRRSLTKEGYKGKELSMILDDAMDDRLVNMRGAINTKYYVDKANGKK